MKLSQKLKKIANPEMGTSIKRAVLRITKPLPMSYFLKHVDTKELQRIQDTYGVAGEVVRWPKYVDTPHYMRMNIRRAQDLGLDRSEPKHILDIGSGAGYFLFVCRVLGHTGMGVDLAEPQLYEDMFRLFGLKRMIGRVDKFQPIPDTGAKYDLITSFAIVFNNHSKEDCWGEKEWDYFLDDATTHLKPGGRIFLNLNPHPKTGSFYTPELKEYFLRKGAQIDHRCNLTFPVKKA